jgi:hypothetical protein
MFTFEETRNGENGTLYSLGYYFNLKFTTLEVNLPSSFSTNYDFWSVLSSKLTS